MEVSNYVNRDIVHARYTNVNYGENFVPTREYSQDQYRKDFTGEKRKEALKQALDIRKFEIDLYWKRAAYFWTFIGATFAGFIAIQASSSAQNSKQDLSVILCCLGSVFSFAWILVNRGSKQWQENWEKHVDMLEDKITGPLYKVVLTRNKPKGFSESATHLITGPSPISVSKINQIISLYVTLIWLTLLVYSLLPFDLNRPLNIFYCVLIFFSFLACTLFAWLGRTYSGGFWHKATIRTTEIKNN